MAGRLTFEVVVSFDRLAEVVTAWRALWWRCPGATPFSSPEWLLPWCRHLATGPPRSVLAWRGGEPAALAPTFVYQAGGQQVLGLLGGGPSDYQDVLAEDPAIAEAVLGFLGRRSDHQQEPAPGAERAPGALQHARVPVTTGEVSERRRSRAFRSLGPG